MQTPAVVGAAPLCLGQRERLLVAIRAKASVILFVLLLLLALPMRLVNIQAPFTGEHEFRQTQTALSVWEIREHGFSLLHPRLPLFGPPWECPFEYPVFQTIAAAVDAIAPWSNLDISIRVTNLMFFYLTAIALALLARLLFQDSATALFTTAIFVFSPYNTFWSCSSMIEFAATFFGLAHLVTFMRWTLNPGRTLFVACLGLGILSCLTKATSFVIPLIVAGAFGALHCMPCVRVWSVGRGRATPNEPLSCTQHPVRMLAFGGLLMVPLLLGYWYIHFSDLIKEQMPYTAWLSSRHPYTHAWTYGTWAQRLRADNWNTLWHRAGAAVMPLLTVALIVGWVALPFRIRQFKHSSGRNLWLGWCAAVAPLLAVFVFFNLFLVHTYYLIACTPFLALYAGVGFGLMYSLARTRILQITLVLLLVALDLEEWSERYAEMLYHPKPADARVKCLAEAARSIRKDEPVIILSSLEWSAFAPYYLKRRAIMAFLPTKPVDVAALLEQNYFKQNGFHWLLLEGDAPGMSELAGNIKSRWKFSRQVSLPAGAGYVLFSLADQ
jgi:hypothetical protein